MPDWTRTLGTTGLTTTAVTVGTSPLGSMPLLYGYDTPEAQAIELVTSVLDSPIRSFDTANGYSGGESEKRIGAGLEAYGGKPSDFLVVTKVDALDGDYSGERVRLSVKESKERLGLDTLPLVHLHDPENQAFEFMSAPGGAVETLVALRDEGEIDHIGLAGGPTGEMRRYIDLGVFEAILVHNRYTLVDRSAEALLRDCRDAGLGIINAAVYGGGILARSRSDSRNYGYRPAHPDVLAAVDALTALCDEHGVDLGVAALQFSLRDPLVDTTVVGISKASRLPGLLSAAATTLPDEFWERAAELTPAASAFLDA